MKYLDCGENKMPALGFGTWQLEGNACVKAIEKALDIGYRHIDTAQIYGNEAEIGEALSYNIEREELFVTTKIWITNFTAPLVASSFEESLNKLRMDYVDLLLMHWPNPDVPMEDTLTALQKLVAAKKVRNIGVSNFPVAEMREAVEKHMAPITCNQVEYHIGLSQEKVLSYARAHNIITTAYSPLARGAVLKNPVLIDIGKKYGKTPAQVALRWLIEQDMVAAIPKSASENNMRANFEIFDFELSAEDKAAIDKLPKNKRTINPDFAPRWDN